jgi:hypothetical protein
MAFQFAKKPQPQPAQPAQEQSPAEIKAERLRIAREAAEIARRRRERIAKVQAGRLSRQELDESERILLESYERKEETEQRPGFFEKLARRIAGSGLGVLIGSIITATASLPSSCGGATNPFLLRVAGVLGGLGLVALAVAAAVWLFRQLFL